MERRRRRWWTVTITVVSALIVLAAMISGAFQIAVRSVPGYRAQLEQRLGDLLGRPVTIGDLRLTWRGYYPSLDLDRLTLLPTSTVPDAVSAERLRLAFSLPRLASGDWMPARIDLIGAEIVASRDAEGHVHVRGFEPSTPAQPGGSALERLRQISALRVQRCVLIWNDEPLALKEHRFEITRVELDQTDQHFEFDLELGLPATLGQELTLHADLDGQIGDRHSWTGPWAAYLRGVGDGPLVQRLLAPGTHFTMDRARLRVKGELQNGDVPSMDADGDSGPIDVERAGLVYHLNGLKTAAQITAHDGAWSAEISQLDVQGSAGPWPSNQARITFTRAGDGFELDLAADFLRLTDVAPWLQFLRAVPPKAAALHDAGGDVEKLTLRLRHHGDAEQYSVAANLKNLHLAAAGRSAGFANLTGQLAADDTGGHLTLQQVPLWFELPHAFPGPGQFDALSGVVSWQRAGEDWKLRVPDLKWRIAGADGSAALSLLLPREGAPVIDLNSNFAVRDATRFKPFVPFKWGTGLRDWLDRAILAARVPRAELTIRGPLSDFPFHKTDTGMWQLDIDVADVQLDFHPDWPQIERLGAHLRFHGNALDIEADGAAMLGARIGHVNARFDDFKDARLIIDGEVGGDLSKLYRLIESSPLEKTLGALVHHTRAAGAASVDLHLDIPLHDSAKTVAAGVVKVKDARLEYHALKEPIRGIAGEVKFGPEGVSADSLIGQFYEVPLKAKVTALTPHLSRLVAEFRYAPRADGTGVSTLVPEFVRTNLSGESAWRAELDIGAEADASLRLQTDLQGVAVKFPPPLAKKADEASMLKLNFSGTEKIPLRIGIDYDKRFTADLQFASGRAGMDLGNAFLRIGDGPAVAKEPGIVVEGHVAEFDLAAWTAALSALTGGGDHGPSAFRRADLTIDRPIVGGQIFGPTHVVHTPREGGWQATFDGEGIEGLLTWTSAADGTLTGKLKHASMEYHAADEPAAQAAPARPPLEPAKLPVIDVDCAILKVAGLDFGHLRVATERVPGGHRIKQLKLDGGALDFDGNGQWWRRAGASGANLSFHLASAKTADVLRALGYAPSLTAKSSKFDGDLLWAPSAAGIELAQARGHLSLDIQNGNLKAIEPGAGRVLGLLNFYALPRRLTLNFRDVVGQGLGFDKISGSFDLGDGNAYTSDMEINGPSVRMETRGRVGLAARDYDQHVRVYPDMSSGITLGALLIGGPALGALALIAQQVLDKPLDQVTELTYHLGGTWDNPEIKRGDREEGKPRHRAEPGKP